MFRSFAKKLFSLRKGKREFFLVIEDCDGYFRVTPAKISADKKIHLSSAGRFERFEKIKKSLTPIDKLIVAVSSAKAFTVESVITLKRSDPRELIKEPELDTLVFRGLWEFINRHRPLASNKLKVSDLDLILAQADIREVQIGSSRVFNPVDFKASTISFRFRGTFISRRLLDWNQKIKSWADNVFIVERGNIIGHLIQPPTEVLLVAGEKTTEVFSLLGGVLVHSKTLLWGTESILEKIGVAFSVDKEKALRILELANSHSLSDRMKRMLEGVLREEFDILTKLFSKNYGKRRAGRRSPRLYLDGFPVISNLSLGGLFFRLVRLSDYLEKTGYGVTVRPAATEPRFYESALAMIIYPHALPQYDYLNRLLERRAKWLTAHA